MLEERSIVSEVPETGSRNGPAARPTRSSGLARWVQGNWPLLLIAGLGLALRLFVVLVAHPTCPFDSDDWTPERAHESFAAVAAAPPSNCYQVKGDSLGLFLQGKHVAEGLGFTHPGVWLYTGEYGSGAGKPPLFTLVIATLHVVGLGTPTWVRVVTAIGGTAAILVIAYVASRLAGKRAGIIAAVIAALYPILIISDWRMLNESFLGLAVAAVLAAAYRFWQRPRVSNAILFGLAIAVAGHLRTEITYQFLVLLVPPLVWSAWRLSRQRRVKLIAVIWLSVIAVSMPWNLYLWVTMDEPALMATGFGSVLKNGSCDQAWFGRNIGYLEFSCFEDATTIATQLTSGGLASVDESQLDRVYRDRALEYISANAGRIPIVVAARVGRIWEVYAPFDNVKLNDYVEGRGYVDSLLGLLAYWALLPFGLLGVYTMYKRRIPISPLVAPVIGVTLTAAISFALTRFRLPADVALVVAAAVGLDAVVRRRTAAAGNAGAPRLTAIERLAATRPARRPMARDTRTLLAGGGLVGAVVVVMVLVWSSQIEPARPAGASQEPTADARLAELCDYAAAHGISGGNLGRLPLEGPGLRKTVEDFEYLASIAPADLRPSLGIVRDVLRRYLDSGEPGGKFITTLTPEERQQLGTAIEFLLNYQQTHCPATTSTTAG